MSVLGQRYGGRGPKGRRNGAFNGLTFKRNQYHIAIPRVREAIGMTDEAPIPVISARVKGVIDLLGRTIPFPDHRPKFGPPSADRCGHIGSIVNRTNPAVGAAVIEGGMDILLDIERVVTDDKRPLYCMRA